LQHKEAKKFVISFIEL